MIDKIIKIISDNEYEIKFIRDFRRFRGIPVKGFIEPDNDTILNCRNLSREEKIITIIHEFLHEIKPEWSENKVESYSNRLFRELKTSEMRFFDNLLQ